jgi:soluble lytic murein transglycosylase-like protein
MPPIETETNMTCLPEKSLVIKLKKETSFCGSTKQEDTFESIIQQAAEHHQVDLALIKAIIMAESSFNPRAVSERGAVGLMQLMPQTAMSLGVKDCFNPEHNIHAGVKYFKQLLNRFEGDIKLALAAYNAGSRKVKEYHGVPPFKATQQYIKKVLIYYDDYKLTS